MVAPQGFEPRYAAPEAAVLPLNEGAIMAKWFALKPGRIAVTGVRHTDQANLSIIRGFAPLVKRVPKVGVALRWRNISGGDRVEFSAPRQPIFSKAAYFHSFAVSAL